MFTEDPIVALVRTHGEGAHERAIRWLREAARSWVLTLDVPISRLMDAVKDEVAHLNDDVRAQVTALRMTEGDDTSHNFFDHAEALLDPGTCTFAREDIRSYVDELSRADASGVAPLRQVLGDALARHADLEQRVSRMLQPLSPEQLSGLDPARDYNAIHQSVTYWSRLERFLFRDLAETRPLIVPYANAFFYSTGEFTIRARKRLDDTGLLLDNYFDWGPKSKRGQQALRRINRIHGRYTIPNDTMKWVLLNLALVPLRWNERVGGRPYSQVEREGFFIQHMAFGRELGLDGLTDDLGEMTAWWEEVSRAAAPVSDITRTSFEKFTSQLFVVLDPKLRRAATMAYLAGMDDPFRRSMGYPAPDDEAREQVRSWFRVGRTLLEAIPAFPWCMSLRSTTTYPQGARVDEIGVYRRGHGMPKMAVAADAPAHERRRSATTNAGYPEWLPPLTRLSDAPVAELPVLTLDEVARHASPDDAWIAVGGFVYDVTPFLNMHPGGRKVLLPRLGRDATKTFEAVKHSDAARILMTNFRVGRLAAEDERAHEEVA